MIIQWDGVELSVPLRHQADRRWRGNDLLMPSGVIGMGVGDERERRSLPGIEVKFRAADPDAFVIDFKHSLQIS